MQRAALSMMAPQVSCFADIMAPQVSCFADMKAPQVSCFADKKAPQAGCFARAMTRASVLCTLLLALAGCEENLAPPFPEGQGQAADPGSPYPTGPYGVAVGEVIPNFEFVGYANPDASTDEERAIELAEFWNPTALDTFPEESIFGAGELKPTVLVIVVSAVWCGPCQYESAEILPGEHAKYAPRGAQFLLQLADGPSAGSPAELSHLKSWTTKYETRFPAVVDPKYQLGSLFPSSAFPANILIDTRTMEIVDVVTGIPEEGSAFFEKLEALLRE